MSPRTFQSLLCSPLRAILRLTRFVTGPRRPPALAHLAELLCAIFDDCEFQRFFAAVTNDFLLCDYPRHAGSRRELVYRAVEHFDCLRCIKHVFFDRMIAERPYRWTEIDAVRRACIGVDRNPAWAALPACPDCEQGISASDIRLGPRRERSRELLRLRGRVTAFRRASPRTDGL